MQLVLQGTGKPTAVHFFSAKVLLNAWLQYNGVFLHERDIEVTYNGCYDIWDISIYRSCIAGHGHGSPEYRDKNWIEQKEIIDSLLKPFSSSVRTTCRMSDYDCYIGLKLDRKRIPGIRYFVERDPAKVGPIPC